MYQLKILILIGLVKVVVCQPPSYSARYGKVFYQTQTINYDTTKSELNLSEKLENSQKEKEELTEKPIQTRKSPEENNQSEVFSSAEFIGVTTEKESEQINFARITYNRVLKDKLVMESDTKRPEIDEAATNIYENIEHENKKQRTHDTSSDESTETELDDLNEQGVYYILHPNGLFQKVVYKTHDEHKNMQFSTQVLYENVTPIVEPIYTYDPNTFAFQRLLLRTQPRI